MKKYGFRIAIVVLVLILGLSIFYMVYVHVPYYNYHHKLDLIRNEICETNHYDYDDYFHAHHGKEVYYIIRVKANDKKYFAAFNEKKELIDSLEGPFADEKKVIKAIEKKYKTHIDSLDVGYENNRFVYCQKIMEEDKLTYVYYSLETGEFVKAYFIEG